MKIVILGAGKMGSFFADVLSFDHEIALYDIDPHRLRFAFNTLRMTRPEEIQDFTPKPDTHSYRHTLCSDRHSLI